MRNEILENKEFNILSRSIDNASRCCVIEVCDDCFKVKLEEFNKYETDESVELFSMTKKGQLYFETIIKEVNNDILSIWFPITYKYLQRREYSRIQSDKTILLNNGEQEITARIIDISAGGMKLSVKEQLKLLTEYNIKIEIENRFIESIFEPIRIEVIQDEFVVSGRFKNLSNYDRVAMVQYCFRRQIENNNK